MAKGRKTGGRRKRYAEDSSESVLHASFHVEFLVQGKWHKVEVRPGVPAIFTYSAARARMEQLNVAKSGAPARMSPIPKK